MTAYTISARNTADKLNGQNSVHVIVRDAEGLQHFELVDARKESRIVSYDDVEGRIVYDWSVR